MKRVARWIPWSVALLLPWAACTQASGDSAGEVEPAAGEAGPEEKTTADLPAPTGSPSDDGASPEPGGTLEAQSEAQLRATQATMLAALNRGRDAVKRGELDAGIAEYHRLLRIDPHYGPALGELGWAEFKAERWDAATLHTRQALARAQDDTKRGMYHYNLGRIAEARGETEEAIEAYAISLRLRPHATVADRLRQLGHAVDAAGEHFDHPAVTEYDARFGPEAPAKLGHLRVLAKGLADIEAACERAVRECAPGPAECSFTPHRSGEDESWGHVKVDDDGIIQCWHPVMKQRDGWSVFSAGWVGQRGSEIDQGVDEITTRIESNAAAEWLIFDFGEHTHERDWTYGTLEEDGSVPFGSSYGGRGLLACRRAGTPTCTQPVLSHSRTEGAEHPRPGMPARSVVYDAELRIDGDALVVEKVVTEGEVDYSPRASEWDPTRPLPAGRYSLK